MDIQQWLADMLAAPHKKPMPLISSPGIQLLHVSMRQLVADGALQAQALAAVARRLPGAAATVSMMDLSVEAECFGSTIRFSDDEAPTVIGGIVKSPAQAHALAVPEVGAGRTGIYIEAARRAKQLIDDRPVFAGVIGPFSLAGRLMDVSQAMMACYDEPDMVHALLDKVTDFLTQYVLAYKAAGADGVIIAEPLAGLLSPALGEEFSARYVGRIVEAALGETFLVGYHNCGGATIRMIDSILATGAPLLHFGNAITMADMLAHIPADRLVMGNIDPAGQLRNGTPESVRTATRSLLEQCAGYGNFVPSTGCDVPPLGRWENIDAFMDEVSAYYRTHA